MSTKGIDAMTSAAPVRLTRRGRLTVFALFLAGTLSLLTLLAGERAVGSGAPTDPVPVRVVHVQAGDTLWGIAQEVRPGVDPREVMLQIERLNPQVADGLRVGERLVVPSAWRGEP